MKRIATFFISCMAALVLMATPADAVTIQSGSFTLDDSGSSAVQYKDTSTFTTIEFPTPFPEGSSVIVIPMVQTFNGADTPGLRIANVTTTGFEIRMNELIAHEFDKYEARYAPRSGALSDGKHYSEKIGWIAIGS